MRNTSVHRHEKKQLNAYFGILLCTASLNLHASFEEAEDFFNLSFEELLNVSIDSATKTATNISKVPAPVTSFSRTEIASLGVRYLHELLEYVPGYQVKRYANYQQQYSVTARGLSDGASSKKILFLLDGHPINDPRTGGDQNLYNYSVEHIERIEIIRGPGSAIYGSNAFTGVVNIIPRKAATRVIVGIGNELNTDIFAQGHGEIGEFTSNIQANYIDSQGDEFLLPDTFSSAFVATNDPFKQYSVHWSLENENIKVAVDRRYLDSKEFYAVQRVSNKYNRSKHKVWLASAEYKANWWTDTQSTVSVDFTDVKIQSGSQSTPVGAFSQISEPASDEPLYGVGFLNANRIHVNLFNNTQFSAQQSLQYGLSWHKNKETKAQGLTNFDISDIESQTIPIRYYPNLDVPISIGSRDGQYAIGAMVQYQLTQGDWFWILGGRLDDYDEFGQQFTPRLGLTYSVNDETDVKLLYGEAFRAPDLSEVSLINGVTRAGNPDLTYEYIDTVDLIAQYTGDKLLMSFNVFYNKYHSPIIEGLYQGKLSFINGEDSESYGLEAEAKLFLSNHTWLRIAATEQFELPSSAYREADELVNVHINHSLDKLQLGLSAIYRSDRQTLVSESELETLPGYWFWRSHVRYQLESNWQIKLLINNLEDKQFLGPAIGSELPKGTPTNSLQWVLTTEYQF